MTRISHRLPEKFSLYYKLDNKAAGKEVARGKTGIFCFDYEKRKVAAIPEELMEKLRK